MGLDTTCGEGDTVMTTRKMIGSVLQMMIMVCRQIEARGDAPIPPLSTQHGMPPNMMPGPVEPLESVDQAREENIPGPARDDLPAFLGASDVEDDKEVVPTQHSPIEDKLKKQPTAAALEPTPSPSAASQSQSGHDAAHPVTAETKILGWPLWLVIFVGVMSLLVFCLCGVTICLCVRRRRQKKVEIQIEKQAQPLDGKLYTVGIPPPAYVTTAIPQTQDGLHLPPLDLSEESAAVPVDDNIDEKPPMEASDADDESDEKEKEEATKKKKHAEKKGKE